MSGRLIKSLVVALLMILAAYLADLPLKSVALITLIPILCALINVLFGAAMSVSMVFIAACFLWWVNPFNLQRTVTANTTVWLADHNFKH
jgi:hypothetical protein